MRELRERIANLLAEAEILGRQPNPPRLLPWAIDRLRKLEEEFSKGEPDAERLHNISYGIYRTVEGDDIADTVIGQKLLDLSTDLAREAKRR